jgi:urease accessory protein
MTLARKHLVRAATVFVAMLPAAALAHPGHGETSTFVDGAMHPLGGIDHVVALLIVGLLAQRLGGRYWWPMSATLLGLLVSAWTADSDGWRYAAGFMLSSAGLIAAGVAATSALIRFATANARRSPI